MLLKQEPIQGSENTPIARFFGLGCYQTHSEIGGVFQHVAVPRCGVWHRRGLPQNVWLCKSLIFLMPFVRKSWPGCRSWG